jgi:riboflavin transporter FmnP
MKSYHVKFVARTAILLALCLVVQQFKTLSQFLTGPLVNLILLISALAVGLWSGLIIAVLSPVAAYLIAPSPVMRLVPQLIFMIMAGNALIVIFAWLFRSGDKKLWIGLALGSVLKAGFLTLALHFIILPFFGDVLKEPQRIALSAMFSYNQLITAVTGSLICALIWPRLKKSPSFVLQKSKAGKTGE